MYGPYGWIPLLRLRNARIIYAPAVGRDGRSSDGRVGLSGGCGRRQSRPLRRRGAAWSGEMNRIWARSVDLKLSAPLTIKCADVIFMTCKKVMKSIYTTARVQNAELPMQRLPQMWPVWSSGSVFSFSTKAATGIVKNSSTNVSVP